MHIFSLLQMLNSQFSDGKRGFLTRDSALWSAPVCSIQQTHRPTLVINSIGSLMYKSKKSYYIVVSSIKGRRQSYLTEAPISS